MAHKTEIIVDDLVSGIIGHLVRVEKAPMEFRSYVYYKDATIGGIFSKPKRIPGAIPPEGMKEIDGTACADGMPRLVIFSYGDSVVKPIIVSVITKQVDDIIMKGETLTLDNEMKSAALQTEKTIFERSKEQIISKAIETSNAMQKQPQQKPRMFPDIPMDGE